MAVGLLAGCSDDLPPLGEAVFVVDTDLPVPVLASSLRLDLYDDETGRWYASRTVPLPDPSDWPASFSLFNPEDASLRRALVRLRVYPRGRERDYRGERYLPPPAADLPDELAYRPPPPPAEGSEDDRRLVVDGVDITPATEPDPGLTVDRLLRVELTEGNRGQVRLLMRGDCIGTQADLTTGQSCIDTERQLEPAVEVSLEGEAPLVQGSQQGTFAGEVDCSRPPRPTTLTPEGGSFFDDEVCVPGGAFIFGNAEAFGLDDLSGVPERVAVLAPFFVDRYEISVRRIRRAFAEGWTSPDNTPFTYNDPIVPDAANSEESFCNFTSAPNLQGREDHAANCITFDAAASFCAFYGGSLPTEAQWEYVAQAAGRPLETVYPWGNADPDCDEVIFARVDGGSAAFLGADICVDPDKTKIGPLPVNAGTADASVGLRIHGLGGGMVELTADDFAPLESVCWARAPLREPGCQLNDPLGRSVRGGSWGLTPSQVYPGQRAQRINPNPESLDTSPVVGFRCVYPD